MDMHAALVLAMPLIYGSEGCELVAYLDRFADPPVWTIGHGTTHIGGMAVDPSMTCTREQADGWAIMDMAADATEIVRLVHVPLSDQQAAACISLAYNIGFGAFARSSVLEALNAKLYYRAADRFLQYDHADGVKVDGLDVRRKREQALFLSGTPAAPHIPAAPAESAADTLNDAEIARIRRDDGSPA